MPCSHTHLHACTRTRAHTHTHTHTHITHIYHADTYTIGTVLTSSCVMHHLKQATCCILSLTILQHLQEYNSLLKAPLRAFLLLNDSNLSLLPTSVLAHSRWLCLPFTAASVCLTSPAPGWVCRCGPPSHLVCYIRGFCWQA